jgi:cell division protein FtsW
MIRAGHAMVLSVVALLLVGVVMISSAGMSVQPGHSLSMADVLLGKTMLLAAVSIVALVTASCINVHAIYRIRGLANPIPWLILGILGFLVLVQVPGIGREVNGARRWIGLAGGIGFQPSELAKWGILLVLAGWGTRRVGAMPRFFHGFLPPMLLVGLVCALIAIEDLGTAVLIATVAVLMLLAAGARWRHVIALLPIGLAGFVAAVMVMPYRLKRLQAFLEPFADPQDSGYQLLQSLAAISGGGLAGRGLGAGVQKFDYLPEDTTDFIFAIICEEMGIVGAILIVALYACLIISGLAILRNTTHPFCRLLTLGVLATIALQALINMFVVTGLAPTKGIALPLVSSGGTGWVLTAFSIGLVISLDRGEEDQAIETEPIDDEPDDALPASAIPSGT